MFAMAPQLAKKGLSSGGWPSPGTRTNGTVVSLARTVDELGPFVLALGLNR